ncbi:MAG: M1 family metallopeptidase [Acidobacteriota bacterium]|jgi:aminopeptidase N
MRNVIAALLTLSLFLAPAASADDYPRNWDVDVLHYRFQLTLSDSSNEISGEAAITVRFARAGISEIAFDLIGHDAGEATGMEVLEVTRDGQPVSHTHIDGRLRIHLANPSLQEERRTYTVSYRGVPGDGLIIDATMFGDRSFFGDNWPNRARHWLPTVDHVSDKATVEWIVVAPGHYQVVANGSLLEVSDLGNGMRRTHWASHAPLATKVMVLGAARFAVQHVGSIDGVPLQSWVYPQNRDAGFYDYAVAERVLRFFDAHIGPFPYAKLANVQSKTRYGGMENASNIFYSERSVNGARGSEGTVAHEIAHQWFGDAVTEKDWHHLWLSEGFATYFTQLYNEFIYGRDRMVRGMQGARATVVGFYEANPELALIAEQLHDPNRMLNRNAYQKGAWVLHMLRHQIGDDAFWAGIRAYYVEFRDGNALTEDFQRVMEEASGQDLQWFFDQWAHVPGHPLLSGTWSFDAGSGTVTVSLSQEPRNGYVFRFPLDIGIRTDGSATRVETVQVEAQEQTFSLAVDGAPSELILDPDTWLLFEGSLTPR